MIELNVLNATKSALKELYSVELPENQIQVQKTKKEFEGNFTLVVFPFLRASKKGPEQTAEDIGNYLKANISEISDFNVVKGFLNLSISDAYWLKNLNSIVASDQYGFVSNNNRKVFVEFSSPNTNKPLHLGHIRNILLGYSVSEILKANGFNVLKTQIINDRGVHVCKSMLAWQKWGNGETPQSSGLKGDKLVGKYYVEFDKHYKAEVEELVAGGMDKEKAEKEAVLIKGAQSMLKKWESGDAEVRALWAKMNGWCYEGFDVTYNRLGVDFDELYYESNTYLEGKKQVEIGLEKGIFFKKEDGSIWVDLTDDGLDEKLLLRADGTAVYMTQDIGTAILRYENHKDVNQMIYTVGNEQDYHFKVLFLILGKLGYEWAKECYHLSYGMVDLPSGKMKSREGTVVDADDLMQEMYATAKATAEELGKLEGIEAEAKEQLYENIGVGALKYFMLKVDPKKRMLFNPEESVDFNGNTGPFIQYAHARIQSILRRFEKEPEAVDESLSLSESEKNLIVLLSEYPATIKEAGKNYSPALIANYTYELVKGFNSFYQSTPILKAETDAQLNFRVQLSKQVGLVIKSSMKLLGVESPERM